VLSVFGEHVADAVFMKRGPQSTLMEFFPPDVFNRDWETVVQSMGIRYIAWQDDQLRIALSSHPFGHMLTHGVSKQKIL
jgi:hypothetical protein